MASDTFRRGLAHGVPIALGYFSVSIGFGLMAVSGGLSIGQAVLISMTNLTSAGQLAGIQVMFAAGSLVEMAVSQLFINLRYALMSIGLSQKLDEGVGMPARLGIAAINTDEIYAVSASQPGRLTGPYMAGLALLPYIGWALGTLVGAVAGALLPDVIRNGMGLAIYGMFLAIILPPAKKEVSIRMAVIIAAVLSCVLRYTPGLSAIPGGFAIVLCALAASVICAVRYPIDKEAA